MARNIAREQGEGFRLTRESPGDAEQALAQQTAALSQAAAANLAKEQQKQLQLQQNIKAEIKLLTQAYTDQVAVLNAVTVGERAAAVERQTLNELTKGATASETDLAKARLAGEMVRAQARAQDAQQARQIGTSGKDQLELIRLESKLLGENATERTRRLEIMRGEQQARELEKQGLASSAEETRKYTREIANANAELEKQRDIAKLDPQGQYTARQTGLNSEGVDETARGGATVQSHMSRYLPMGCTGAPTGSIGLSTSSGAWSMTLGDQPKKRRQRCRSRSRRGRSAAARARHLRRRLLCRRVRT